jgi:hypothetical protein
MPDVRKDDHAERLGPQESYLSPPPAPQPSSGLGLLLFFFWRLLNNFLFYRVGLWAPRPTPNLEDQASVFISPRGRVAQLYSPAPGTYFRHLLWLALVMVGLFLFPSHHTGNRSHIPWDNIEQKINVNNTAEWSNTERVQEVLNLQWHLWETVGAKTKSIILYLQYGSKTYYHLCCPNVVAKNEITAKLSKLQRMACLGITGAMNPVPVAVAEVLMGVPPIHVMVEGRGPCWNTQTRPQ